MADYFMAQILFNFPKTLVMRKVRINVISDEMCMTKGEFGIYAGSNLFLRK